MFRTTHIYLFYSCRCCVWIRIFKCAKMDIRFLSILISLKCNSVHSLLISYIITVSLNHALFSTMKIWSMCRRITCNALRSTEIVYCKDTCPDNLDGLLWEKFLERSFTRCPGWVRKLLREATASRPGLGSQKSPKATRASTWLHSTRIC